MFKNVLLAAIALFAVGSQARADDYVRGYYKSNGTYVQPYYRTHADGNFWNNYSTYPNVNPYTGQVGTHHNPPMNYGTTTYVPQIYNPQGTVSNYLRR